MKRVTFLLLLILPFTLSAQTQKQVSLFPLSDVLLLESPFKQAQQTDLRYMLSLDADRLLSPFLREAGLSPKATSYTNWENTGLDGHIGGHYLSALSMMYAATGNRDIKLRLDYMLSELNRCQETVATGFIGGTPGSLQLWDEIKQGNIRAGSFDLNGKWVPLYNIHKTYAGLRDAYLFGGSTLARDMLVRFSDWMIDITVNLSDEQIQDMLRSEHGGLNEAFADVASITGDDKYLALARRFSHMAILNPLIKGEDKLTGQHANTQIPKIIGYKRIADLTGDSQWDQAVCFFWQTVIDHRTVCIGGNSVREHFHPAEDFSSMIKDVQGPETCNTYNMLRLGEMLYQTSPDTRFIEYCERALYNHILSSQEPDKGGFVYFTPMRPGHYRVYSQPQASFWCCVGSGLENHAKYGEFIYAHSNNELYVNLFISSRLQWKDKGVTLVQQTHFPDNEQVSLRLESAPEQVFSLKIRYPSWVSEGKLRLAINGNQQTVSASPGEYITLNLPMHVSLEQMPDKSNYYAFMYGPLTLATPTGTQHLDGLYADESRGGHIANGELISMQSIPILIGATDKIVESVHKKNNDQLNFVYQGSLYPKQNQPLELIPFFRLHNARYAIYFRQADQDQLKIIQQKMVETERKATDLAKRTVDLIFLGEQQPESDHNIQYADSEAGSLNNRHFRKAKKWFSYQVKVEKVASYLVLTQQAIEKNRASIYINDTPLTSQPIVQEDETDFVTVTYQLPVPLAAGMYILRFVPNGSEWTPSIFEIRLTK